MKKRFWAVAMAMVLFAFFAVPASAYTSSPTIVLDGVEQSYPVAPVLKDNTLLVPMRPLWESLGAVVYWDEQNRSVRAVKGETTLELTIGSLYARINGELANLAMAPLTIDGATMVPLRFVGESLGARVEWLAEKHQVRIDTDVNGDNSAAQEDSASDESVSTPKEEVLTFNAAVELALQNSTELHNARQSVVQAEELRDQVVNLRRIGYTPVGPGFTDEDAADRELLLRFIQADIGWQVARRQMEMLEESIALQVRNAYNEVLQKEGAYALAAHVAQNEENKLHQARLKAGQGMLSAAVLENVEKAYHGETLRKESLKNQLDEARINLKRLLRLEDITRLEVSPIPDTASDIDLEHHIRRILQQNPHIWLQEQNIMLAEMELALYTYNVGAPPYRVKEIDVSKEKNNLAILKRNTEEATRSLYYQLKELDNQHSILEINLSKAESALEQTRIYLTLGMVTHADVLAAKLALAQLEHQKQSLALSYSQLYMLFEKPWSRTGF